MHRFHTALFGKACVSMGMLSHAATDAVEKLSQAKVCQLGSASLIERTRET